MGRRWLGSRRGTYIKYDIRTSKAAPWRRVRQHEPIRVGIGVTAPYRPVPYAFERYEPEEMGERARSWYAEMDRRRSVRQFSTDPVRHELIADAIRTAGTAPSGDRWTRSVSGCDIGLDLYK